MWGKGKTGLLPKDLAGRAEKLPPEKVEAEVRRIVSAKPATPAPGAILPRLQGVPASAWDLLAQEQRAWEERRRREDQQLMDPWAYMQGLQQAQPSSGLGQIMNRPG